MSWTHEKKINGMLKFAMILLPVIYAWKAKLKKIKEKEINMLHLR